MASRVGRGDKVKQNGRRGRERSKAHCKEEDLLKASGERNKERGGGIKTERTRSLSFSSDALLISNKREAKLKRIRVALSVLYPPSQLSYNSDLVVAPRDRCHHNICVLYYVCTTVFLVLSCCSTLPPLTGIRDRRNMRT